MKKSHKKLELDKILDMLANEAHSDECKEKIILIEPKYEPDEIRKEIKKTDDAFVLSSKFGTPRFFNIKNMSNSAKRASSGSKLSLRELLDVKNVLMEIHGLTSWYSQCENSETSLAPFFAELTENKSLEESIKNSIISENEISDSASPELARIRKAIIRKSGSIREQLDKLIKGKETQKYLQENIVTIRDGRYVVPVKTEHKNNINGLVHDTSATGATLFIEPMSIVEINNEIRILKGEEQQEIDRIIADLSRRTGEFSELLIRGYDASIELEVYFAKANLGARMRGITPEVCNEPLLYLNKARHPLINRDTVVPTTISIGENYTTLVITGPNTGGKTVALKTAGLLSLMTMCGLMIPASDGSKVGVFSEIYADIGDEQSIEQSLSTFSSHITNMVEIIDKADMNSLVLIDELGSGTDPIEGAALAVSILSELKRNCCRVIATTHYQEVKMYAIETDGVENACCEFDVNTLKPTYKLIVGIPGKSNAFAISRRIGISANVIDYAKSLVSEENRRFERVVAELEASKHELDALREEAAKERAQTKRIVDELEAKNRELDKQKEIELQKAREKAASIVEDVRFQADLLMEELEKLRKEKDKADFSSKVKSSRSKVNSAMNKMYDTADPVIEKKKQDYVLPRPLKLYDNVKLMDIDKTASVVKLPDSNGNLIVQMGIMRTKTNVNNIQLVEAEEKVKLNGKPMPTKVSKTVQSNYTRKSSMELDIRGMTADDGIMAVDQFIDGCLLSGLQIVTIIHGKGTGALRAAIHQSLKHNKAVTSFRLGVYGEGESGVTVVELKH